MRPKEKPDTYFDGLWREVVAGTGVAAEWAFARRAFVAVGAIALTDQHTVDSAEAVWQASPVLSAADESSGGARESDERSRDHVIGGAKEIGTVWAGVLSELFGIITSEVARDARAASFAAIGEGGRPGRVGSDIT